MLLGRGAASARAPDSPPFLFFQEGVIENRALWRLLKRGLGYRSASAYQKLRRAVERDSAWPPLGKTDFSESVALSMGCREAYANPVFESHEEPRSRRHP